MKDYDMIDREALLKLIDAQIRTQQAMYELVKELPERVITKKQVTRDVKLTVKY